MPGMKFNLVSMNQPRYHPWQELKLLGCRACAKFFHALEMRFFKMAHCLDFLMPRVWQFENFGKYDGWNRFLLEFSMKR